jgi:hypothetical protein
MIQQAVKKYFSLHHHFALPGIGNFSFQTAQAHIDFVNREIKAPATAITFTNDNVVADKEFYNFLSRELQVDEPQAERQFEDFAASLKSELNEQKKIHLHGIGYLTKQSAHLFSFQPEEIPIDYFPVITAERVIRKNATHFVKVGEQERTSTEMHTALHQEVKTVQIEKPRERWWIPAAILAFIGIVALIFYYATHPA